MNSTFPEDIGTGLACIGGPAIWAMPGTGMGGGGATVEDGIVSSKGLLATIVSPNPVTGWGGRRSGKAGLAYKIVFINSINKTIILKSKI